MNTEIPIIVALDYPNREQMCAMLDQLDPTLCRVKIGKTLFTRYGPAIVNDCRERGFDVFLDLKFHDIPAQVAGACRAAAALGVWMLTVHTSGGPAMLRAARDAIDAMPEEQRPLLVGVTVLTSLSSEDLTVLGMQDSIDIIVPRLALLAQEQGLDGVVSSPHEAELLRKTLNPNMRIVTPGIRLAGDSAQDQKRILTPTEAVARGVDYLVIGRSITQSKNPTETLAEIASSIA